MKSRLRRQIEELPSSEDMQEIFSNKLNLSNDPVKWTEQTRILKGEPFKFNKREYLHQIYRDDAKEIYISKGRQTELSESLVNLILHNAWKYPNTVHLYVADRESHTSKFSNLRVRDWAIKTSEIINKIAPYKKHTATQLPFNNGSIAYFHSAWSGFKEALSVPADFVYIDEIQEMDLNELDVVRETLSHSKYGILRGVGTGSDIDTPWYKLYHLGTQYKWDSQSKSWITKNIGSAIHTYNIPQTIVPWITPAEIEDKHNRYTPRRFITEVLGGWAKGVEKPITENMLKSLFDSNIHFTLPKDINRELGPVLIGIDWASGGKSSTVAWIIQAIDIESPVFRVLYIAKINESSIHKISQKIINLIDNYEPDLGVMDAGGGATQVQDIESNFGNLIIKCSYMTRPGEPWKYDDLISYNTIKIDRSYSIEQVIDLIERPIKYPKFKQPVPRIQIPHAKGISEKVEWIIDEFTCIYTKPSRTASGEKHLIYTKDEEDSYDALMACNYANIAFQLWKRNKDRGNVVLSGTLGGG